MKKLFTGYGPNEKEQNAVEISIDYCEGGYNYFNGGINERGYYAYFTVCQNYGSSTVFTPMSSENFKVFVLPVTRRNKRKHTKLFELIATKEIADLVWEGEKRQVYNKVTVFDIK